MSGLYHRKEWKDFRKEIIELDGGLCSVCKRSEVNGVILQIHHKKYDPGKKPWEYSYSDCETLCKGCHASKHGIVIPKTGWDYIDEEDSGDLCESCDYCGTSIRYVFYIHHPNWEPMGVGTICCDNLTDTKLASNFMESQRRFFARRDRFLESTRWTVHGNNHKIKQKGIYITIQDLNEQVKINMNNVEGKGSYTSVIEAKNKAFEVIENGKAIECLKKRSTIMK